MFIKMGDLIDMVKRQKFLNSIRKKERLAESPEKKPKT